jgi:formylglycine-generating enzyme required for sulfatase activity
MSRIKVTNALERIDEVNWRATVLALVFGFGASAHSARADEGMRSHPIVLRDCAIACPELVVVKAGDFFMGSSVDEERRRGIPKRFRGYSTPLHRVSIEHDFALGKFAITRSQFALFVRNTGYLAADQCDPVISDLTWRNPGFPQMNTDPVVCVTWDDANAYIAWLSTKTGHHYRLPSEAEWEFAARQGMSIETASKLQHEHVNHLGISGMLDGVAQWTKDCWNKSFLGAPSDGAPWLDGTCTQRVIRGDDPFGIGAWVVRLTNRNWQERTRAYTKVGFRVARDL